MTKEELKPIDVSKYTVTESGNVIKDIKYKLKQEAEEYFKSICEDYNEEYELTGKRHYWVGYDIKNAYLAAAESREKRIAELEVQIEKMKCCWNCKHFDKLYNRCELTRFTLKSCLCNSLDKWEIKEK